MQTRCSWGDYLGQGIKCNGILNPSVDCSCLPTSKGNYCHEVYESKFLPLFITLSPERILSLSEFIWFLFNLVFVRSMMYFLSFTFIVVKCSVTNISRCIHTLSCSAAPLDLSRNGACSGSVFSVAILWFPSSYVKSVGPK